jgi:hypothetical protein
MVTPVKERMRKLRERRQAEGMVRVEVVLSRDLLDRCRLPRETINDCLQRILLQYVSGNRPQPQPIPVSGDTVATIPLNHVSGNKSQTVSGDSVPMNQIPLLDDAPQKAVSGNSQDIPVSGDRTAIIDWIIVAKDAMRLSYQKIADLLNSSEVPTVSGRGKWDKKSVQRLYMGKTT